MLERLCRGWIRQDNREWASKTVKMGVNMCAEREKTEIFRFRFATGKKQEAV
jgi:hypothetical protein